MGPLSLNSTGWGVSGQRHVPTILPPEKEPTDNHCMRGWLGPGPGLDALKER